MVDVCGLVLRIWACGFRGDRLRHNLSFMSLHSGSGPLIGHPKLISIYSTMTSHAYMYGRYIT